MTLVTILIAYKI